MGEMSWAVTLGEQTFDLILRDSEERGVYILEISGEDDQSGCTPVSLQHVYGDKYLITLGNRTAPVFICRTTRGYRTVLYGHEFTAEVEEARLFKLKKEMAALRGSEGPVDVIAPMPGLVLSVEVEQGQQVSGGSGVAVVESMKMENEIRATHDGIVERVMVEAGQVVDKGETLVRIVPPE